jgi:DNA adenine methylase
VGSAFVSPLRYPGGKGGLAPFLGELLSAQWPRCDVYVEPFAGGAGAAVRLLTAEYVDEIVLNDIDRGVAAFWRAILQQTDAFVDRILTCKLDVKEWRRQHDVYRAAHADDLELGFATFYLNRTNRSGILNARPIGGLGQAGKWKLDVRFTRDELAKRVHRLGQYRNRITVNEGDGLDQLREQMRSKRRTFFYVDPPYMSKGFDLYLDTLNWRDHTRLAKLLGRCKHPWMLTYDQDPRVVEELYVGRRAARFELAYTAAVQHVGREYAVFSDNVSVRSLKGLGRDPVFLT